MNPLLLLFVIVFLLNLIPAFAPPTWMVFSFVGFRFPDHAGWTIALIGALAATLGRCLLAKMSRWIVRYHWLSDSSRDNVDVLRDELQKRPKLTFGLFLFYAFTPLPSNAVFISYGLTTMSLFRIAVPFFIGRFVSYTFWALSAAAVSRHIEFEDTEAFRYFSVYFVVTQLFLLGIVYVFTRIDWKFLFTKRKWGWISRKTASREKPSPPELK